MTVTDAPASEAPTPLPTDTVVDLATERLRRRREAALGYRIFASLKWGDMGDGHISARDPEHTDHLWLLGYGVPFEHATAADMVLVGPDGHAVDGQRFNRTGYFIHHPIHEARPDAVAAAHTHTGYGTPFCATRRPITMVTQEACAFFDRWASFDDEEVQVRGVEGGQRIAAALDDNIAVLLRNHGLLTVGPSVAETIAAFVTLERVTEALLKAPDATAISDDAARLARDDLDRGKSFLGSFDYLVARHVGDPADVG